MVTNEKIFVHAVNDDAFNNDGSSRNPSSEVDGVDDRRTQFQLLGETINDPLHGLQLSSLRVMISFDGGDPVNSPLLHLVTSGGV